VAGDLGHPGFGQQDHVGSFGEAGADQEVAVAGDPVDRHAGIADGAQRRHDLGMIRIGDVVITGPVLEQVAEQIQLLRVPRMLLQEVEERLAGGRMRRLQMQIGDEQRADSIYQAASSMLSMTTSSTGTSANMPARVVLTFLMASTTSVPSTTLPNTA
jgi:hypothetical protein